MSEKIGRSTDRVKQNIIKFRADSGLEKQLKYYANHLNLNKSKTLRYYISDFYNKITEKVETEEKE
ncbi:MAG: hypothetical protein E7205_12915 [Tissierellaceae bacterium]|nr:hypothetical protein [Tissierellaceae bacterium]